MKTILGAILLKLESALTKAENLADSENEDTAAKYEQCVEDLQATIDALQETIDNLTT